MLLLQFLREPCKLFTSRKMDRFSRILCAAGAIINSRIVPKMKFIRLLDINWNLQSRSLKNVICLGIELVFDASKEGKLISKEFN